MDNDSDETVQSSGLVHRATEGSTSRRRFITAVAAAGTVAGIGGIAMAQQRIPTIKLGGKTSGWVGRAPSSIEGTTNPTLELVPGTDYKITWENVDGQPHNIVIFDAKSNQLKRTKIISEQGATQTLEFTATEAMAEYLCEVHPTTMRGDIALTKGRNGTTTKETTTESETSTKTQTTTAETTTKNTTTKNTTTKNTTTETETIPERPTPAETPAQTFEMVFKNGGWVGRSPSTIEGQTNPTLELEAGKTYRVTWENAESILNRADQRPNFVVLSELDGVNDVIRTDYLSEKGATQSVKFVATDDLSSYAAEAYLDARGEISISGTTGGQQGGNGKAKSGNGKAKSGNGKQG